MPPYSGVQKQLISQFVNFTEAKDAVAAKVCSAEFGPSNHRNPAKVVTFKFRSREVLHIHHL
jgi:hypothetical protein